MEGQLHAEAQHPVDAIADRLHAVLRTGVRPAQLVGCVELLEALQLRTATRVSQDPYELAIALGDRLVAAVAQQGSGPVGRATAALFGVTNEARGRLLKDRRRIAAAELDIMPSTFRKYYEERLLHDVALDLWWASERREGLGGYSCSIQADV